MYQAGRETYEAYGATVLAWGGTPTPESRRQARGVRTFASVGMVTEFAAYHRRFPDTYEAGLCRDVEGKPVKVPWLTDHQSQGVPYWWCCTQQPQFREFLRGRVVEAVKAGADGIHIDDHLGSAGGLWLGLCFCDRCVGGFEAFQAGDGAGNGAAAVDFRSEVRRWLAAAPGRQVTQHPLWPRWTVYQCRAAAAFMMELRQLAAATAGRPVPVGANAGLLWPRHLADYRAVDLFSAETDHHAASRRLPDAPVFAYRLAEAVGRPYAATASGQDWAFIAEQKLPGLVQGWIALGYAAGQRLMAPHRQWCYTEDKGTHWYSGPTEALAPLYRFVRTNAACFDGFETHADLALLLPHGAFVRDPARWIRMAERLSAANISYRVLLAGDDIVDRELPEAGLTGARVLLAPETGDLQGPDAARVRERARLPGVYRDLEEAVAAVRPAVRVRGGSPVRVFPRVRPGAAAIHLVNYAYDPGTDRVRPLEGLELELDPGTLGLNGPVACRWVAPEAAAVPLVIEGGVVHVPRLGLWGMVMMESGGERTAPGATR